MDIDGKEIAKTYKDSLRKEILDNGYTPRLAFILVGLEMASQTYVRMKGKACLEIGIDSIKIDFPETITEPELIHQIALLNQDPTIDGILVQMPLPPHIDEKNIISSVDPSKDVDGFHPINLGKMLIGDPTAFLPCTPHGILKLFEATHIDTEGKHVVIIGRSNIVGKPLANLLIQKRKKTGNATVTIAHSHTQNLKALSLTADILIAALGKPHFVTHDMVKPGAVVIDVGINRQDGTIVGDVDYQSVAPLASFITPVPGGVGPMTIAMLLHNTLQSHKRRKKIATMEG